MRPVRLRRRLRRPLSATLLALAALASVWSLALAPAPAEAQVFGYFGKNKITYEEFDWQIYHSTHFDVYYYPEEEELLPKIVSYAESAYDELSRRLDFQIDEPTALIVYATHSAFEQNNISFNFVPEGLGAFATVVRFRMVMPADLPDGEIYELIKHELTHIFEYHILFQGSLARAVAQRPPTWMMEGFASYMADDEESWDLMYLRDAVVNDAIPPISRVGVEGFLAYRFGHAVFDYMEERWGEDGIQDFIYELRNTIGARADRAIERAFRIEPEDFDNDFRRWLRQRYLPELVASGEPLDFGQPFRIDEYRANTLESSGVASPSGDLVAAFGTHEGELDVILFDARKRRFLRNLTKGFTNQYQFLIGQLLTVGRSMGNDLAFSPDGDLVAVFGKYEGGRSLLLLDVLEGGVARRVDLERLGLEQQFSPAFSPDGRKVAFSAWQDGRFDIFAYDLETEELANLTDDELFDGSPVYAPGGDRLILSSVVDGYQKLFELDLATGARRQVSFGDSHERDAAFSPDGQTLYFTSDRTGADNIYSVDLATGAVTQHTNAVTGCYMPTVLIDEEGVEQVVYTGFWRQRTRLYMADPEDALPGPGEVPHPETETAAGATAEDGEEAADEGASEGREVAAAAEPAELTEPVPPFIVLGGEAAEPEALPVFQPDIEVPIDMANRENYRGLKLFLQNAETLVAVDSDGTVLGEAILSFSDYIGDHQLIAIVQSVYSFSNFDVIYLDTSRRWNWAARLYDDRTYFAFFDETGRIERDRLYAETGLMGYLIYPLSFFQRVEVGTGARYRNIPDDLFFTRELPDGTGETVQIYEAQDRTFPVIEAALVGDSARFAEYGPISGRRWRIGASYAPDLEDSGTLTTELTLDARQYLPLTRRSNLAFRVWGAVSDGNFTRPFFFGGLNQLRGVEIYSQVGDHAFFANGEYRFPLIDLMATPIFNIRNVRGLVFLDVGAAYFDGPEEFDFWDSEEDRLIDPISTYGLGISAEILGLPVHWSFSKRWDFQDTLSDFDTSFWIGPSF